MTGAQVGNPCQRGERKKTGQAGDVNILGSKLGPMFLMVSWQSKVPPPKATPLNKALFIGGGSFGGGTLDCHKGTSTC